MLLRALRVESFSIALNNSSPLRFAIFCAVSSREQAKSDKTSLADQERLCRQAALERGWVESAGPFIVPGSSRTAYISLRDAETGLPALRAALNAAQARRYDVLVMLDLNRLRELMDQVFRALFAYRVQLFNLHEPVEPIDPSAYDEAAAQTVGTLIGVSMITSRYEINQIRFKHKTGMPSRINAGLPAQIPYGYRRPLTSETDPKRIRKLPPEPDPEQTAAVLRMKDLLLSGHSIRQIVDTLERDHIPPPQRLTWHPQTVRDILRNPFYAGQVRFGVSRYLHDPRTGQRRRLRKIPQDQVLQAQGKHPPLWDIATHQAILAELARRSIHYRGRQNNQFTGLVKCGECGASLWRYHNGQRGAHRIVWRCSTHAPDHPVISHERLLNEVGRLLTLQLRPYIDRTRRPASASPDPSALARKTIAELQDQLAQARHGYLKRIFSDDEFAALKSDLDTRISLAEADLQRLQLETEQRRTWLTQLEALDRRLDHLPQWLHDEDPAQVNRNLHLLISSITVLEGGYVHLEFKE